MKSNIEGHLEELDNSPKTSEVSLGTLYDMNKQLMINEPEITEEKKAEVIDRLKDYAVEHREQGYFMLLCHEARDYTLFNLNARDNDAESVKIIEFSFDVIDCLRNRGKLVGADRLEDGAWEFWIIDAEADEARAYYLFPYGAAVLEY